MMWTEITRAKYRREGLRYSSDMTDAEWVVLEGELPAACPLGRPRTTAWLNRNRRLAKDFEATIKSATAWIIIASIKLLSRRIAKA